MSIKKEIFKYYSKRVYIIEVIRSQFYTCLRKCIYPFNNNLLSATIFQGIPGGLVVKNLPASTGDLGSISGLGRSLGGGNGNSLQYSCLGNLMDRGAWQATVYGVTESDTTEQLTLSHTITVKDPRMAGTTNHLSGTLGKL